MKLARLLVSNEFQGMILRGEITGPVVTDAPRDLKIHGFIPRNASPWTMELVVESETFQEVAEGEQLPEVRFNYTRPAL